MSSVTIEQTGNVGYLTLSQPQTLNALTLEMVQKLHAGLNMHEADPDVRIIVIRSASERAFCAGGDVKQVRQLKIDNNDAAISEFFEQEYALNLTISRCSKPYVALIDGVAMGGGLGVSVHGSHVVVTEKARFAMPESRIGFFPDVGASYFLQQLPLACGWWLGLTAAPAQGQQTIQTGLATHAIDSSNLPKLIKTLESGTIGDVPPHDWVSQCLDSYPPLPTDTTFSSLCQARAEWFGSGKVAEIRQQLVNARDSNDDAAHLLTRLDTASPHSLHCTEQLFHQTQGQSLQQCLEAEFQWVKTACNHPDFVEGIRAVLVDKDHKPNWLPA